MARMGDVNFDPDSPAGAEAWAEAQRLVAARLGGGYTYAEELRSRFGGQRSYGQESVAYLLYLVDALVLLAETLVVIATEDHFEGVLEEVKGDPQALLALIDNARDRMERGDAPGD